jgi:uncharacterized protein YjiS (DUF1127 family)
MERAMKTTFTAVRTNRISGWSQVKHSLGQWRQRLRSRQELEGLSDATLRDIGISRCDAQRQTNKPFWMA